MGPAMIRSFGATHPGLRRENNEDAFVLLDHLSAAILADGMGGQNCGEVGSAITIRAASEYLAAPEAGLTSSETAMEAIRAANREVIAAAKLRTECDGMGSTIVLALWTLPEIVLANVGDSRAYLFRRGVLRQLTYDQNFGNELRNQLGFSEERLLSVPNRKILTMAVGTFEHILIRTHVHTLEPGDRILICSDGLYGPVDDDTTAAILTRGGTLQAQTETLIECAIQRGGPDNVTVILLENGEANG
jgi:serine/threonine protein phosphatase PrpC